MLNLIWPIMIGTSVCYALITGNIDRINSSIFESTQKTIELSLTLLGTICLWNGIMEIASETKLMQVLAKALSPFINFLFPESKNDIKIKNDISMNIIANMLGIGNASTPLGLKAIEGMQKKNKEKSRLTDDMVTLIILNTASIQIIPTTVIAIRTSLGSQNPTKIIFAVWFSTICAAIVGITVTKLCIKFKL